MIKELWTIARKTFQEWQEDKASRLAASLAYYMVFSIAPLLLIVIVVVGAVWGEEAARGQIFTELEDVVGAETADAIQSLVNNVNQSQSSGLAAAIGIGGLLISATTIFAQLQDALNTIWDVKPRPGRGILGMVKVRATGFLVIGGLGLLLLLSLVIDTMLNAITGPASDVLPSATFGILLWILNLALGIGLLTLAFALVYKILPDVEISWEDVWVGSLVTAILFTIGRYVLTFYIARNSTASAYGAAGSLIIILLWVNYSAQIFFFGAEFTQVYARRHGKLIQPSENAVPLKAEDRRKMGLDANTRAPAERRSLEAEQGSPAASRKRLTSVAVAGILAFVAGAVAGFFGDKGPSRLDMDMET